MWFSADLIRDIERKANLHRQWRRSGDCEVYARFAGLRADVKLRTNLAYGNYIKHTQTQVASNPRAFWRHVNGLKTKGGFEARVTYSGEQYEGRDAAQAFANFFSSVFLPSKPSLDHLNAAREDPTRNANYINIDTITPLEVERGIACLRPLGSPGPVGIPSYILKGCREWFILPLTYIFNLVLQTGSILLNGKSLV